MSCFQEESDLRNPGIATSNSLAPTRTTQPSRCNGQMTRMRPGLMGYRDTESRIGDAPGP